MIYADFLKLYSVELPCEDGRKFGYLQERGGWWLWSTKPFKDEGLCRCKETGKYYRFSTKAEIRNRMTWCIYTLGPEYDYDRERSEVEEWVPHEDLMEKFSITRAESIAMQRKLEQESLSLDDLDPKVRGMLETVLEAFGKLDDVLDAAPEYAEEVDYRYETEATRRAA